MSEGYRFNFHTVNREDRLRQRISEVSTRLTGGTVVVDGQIEQMPALYSTLAALYARVLSSMRGAQHISAETSLVDDFTVVAFPRSVVSFNMLETVDLITSVIDGRLIVELFFNYNDGTNVVYTSSIHTGSEAMRQRQVPAEELKELETKLID